tara:strand:+ start:217 stop:411 length:195 start_codon:yes stop_codon:yes gene_type:complete
MNKEKYIKNFLKTFFVAEDIDDTFSAFVQVQGFKTEEEAKLYLAKQVKCDISQILSTNDAITFH